MTKPHIVNFSGGVTSWVAAKRVVERYGAEEVVLLCADTGSEAADWYEWVPLAADDVGAELVMVRNEEYDDVIDLAFKVQFLPNPRSGICSDRLKVRPLLKWIKANAPDSYTQHFGFTWDEQHRLDKMRRLQQDGVTIDAPLCWEPMIGKQECLDMLTASGLPVPEAYQLGVTHNNCLKHGCFRQSRNAWIHLLDKKPEAFAVAEAAEVSFRASVNDADNVGILRASTRYEKEQGRGPLLSELRAQHEQASRLPLDGWEDGNCSCFDIDQLEQLAGGGDDGQ